MPCLPRVRSSKLKINVVWLYWVEKGREEGEETWERVFVIFSRVQGSFSVEMQRCFGEPDDQYGKYDLRLSGLAAGSDAKQGFERDAWCLVRGKVDGKIFVWM